MGGHLANLKAIMIPQNTRDQQLLLDDVAMFAAVDSQIVEDSSTASSQASNLVIVDCGGTSCRKSFGWEDFSPPIRDTTEQESEGILVSPRSATARKFCPCSSETDQKLKKKKKNPAKSVSFSNLSIREHGVMVGDHPCAKTLPISLTWEHTEESTIHNVDDYETMRASLRRRGEGIRMTYLEKRNLLKKHGMSEAEIRRAQHIAILNRGSSNQGGPSDMSKIRRVKTLAVLEQRGTE